MTSLYADYPSYCQYPKIADKCDLNIEIGKWYFPKFKLPKGKTAENQLREMVAKSALEQYGKLTPEIQTRLDYELDLICSKGYASYFLIMRDFIAWCEQNDTPPTPGVVPAALWFPLFWASSTSTR